MKRTNAKKKQSISPFKTSTLVDKLKKQKSLCLVFLDLSEFEALRTQYGESTFRHIEAFIQKNLLEASGSKNFFRKNDLLLQDRRQRNHYCLLLSPSRHEDPIVKPGKLREIALRVEKSLEKKLWKEIEKKSPFIAPLKALPHIRVGFSCCLHSLGKDLKQSVHSLVENAKERALLRSEERKREEKEILQYLIATEGFLEAHYQAIFSTKKVCSKNPSRLSHNRKALFANESLIRVNQKLIKKEMLHEGASFLHLNFIGPDVLFEMAKKTGLELELDFKCIEEALKQRPRQKNTLFINILPRNFYLIEKIQTFCPKHLKIYFEISETEAIENFTLIKKLRNKIKKHNFLLAIDDFGQGHSNLARVLALKPDVVKLDRVLIENLHKTPLKRNLIRSLHESLSPQKTLLLAEGVETKEELASLREIGIDLVQGFLTHRPSPPEEIKKQLSQKKKK